MCSRSACCLPAFPFGRRGVESKTFTLPATVFLYSTQAYETLTPILSELQLLLYVDIVQKGAGEVRQRSKLQKLRERRLNLLSNLGQIT